MQTKVSEYFETTQLGTNFQHFLIWVFMMTCLTGMLPCLQNLKVSPPRFLQFGSSKGEGELTSNLLFPPPLCHISTGGVWRFPQIGFEAAPSLPHHCVRLQSKRKRMSVGWVWCFLIFCLLLTFHKRWEAPPADCRIAYVIKVCSSQNRTGKAFYSFR